MTPNAIRLKTICAGRTNLPVLFVSDPLNGDRFEFGTNEELENELEAIEEEDEFDAELTSTHDILARFDLEIYEGNNPRICL